MRRSKPAELSAASRAPASASGSIAPSGISPTEILDPLLWLFEAVGVSRRDVLAAVRALPPIKLAMPVTVVRGRLEYWSGILIRWATDPRFVSPEGRSRDLPFAAGDPSFSNLVALELPRERPAMCREILLATGAIIRLPNGHLRLRERAALATGAESGVVQADEYLRPLLALLLALQTNLLRCAQGAPAAAFQRVVSGFEISSADMAQFQAFVARHGTAFLETVDDWLAHRQREQHRVGSARHPRVRPYVGLYLSTDDAAAMEVGDVRRRQQPKTKPGAKTKAKV
ncbi:MAG TPA: DUF6502 family protein [Steroidobacteraceae bacterium]